MAIAQQLQAEGTAQNNTGQTVSVSLSAGSDRYMVVALSAEIAAGTQAAPTSVTYGGNALSLITDGSVTASQVSTVAGVFLYRLLEANMPANGANNLVVSWPATTTYVMGWWILTGVNQGNASDVKILAETTTATTITITLDAGATTDAVICACYKNDTTGTCAITISGAGVTEDFDIAYGSARGAAGTDLPAVASGTIACVATVSSTTRRILVGVRLSQAITTLTGAVTTSAPAVSGALQTPKNISGAVTSSAPTTSGTLVAESAGGPDPSFVTSDVGNVPRSLVIDADTNLLVVVSTNSAAHGTARTATYNGVTMDAASTSNDFVQIHYMFDPPVGSHTLDVTPVSNLSEVITLQFADMDSFESAQEASVASASFNPSRRAAIVFGMSAVTTAHTPVSSTVEVHDAGGDYAAYRLTTAGGSVTVGVSSATDPDYAGAIFLGTNPSGGVDVSGAVSSSSPSTSGSIQTVANVSGAVTSSSPATSGALQTPKNASGAVTSSAPSTSGALQTVANLSGAVTSSAPATSGSLQSAKNVTGAVASATPTTAGALQVVVNITGAVTSGAPSTAGSLDTPKNVSGAVASSPPATSGSIQVVLNITGSVTSSSPQTAGSFQTPHNLSGSVASSSPQTAGSVSLVDEITVSGAVTSSPPSTAGTLQVVANVSGAVSSSSPTTAGALAVVATIAGAVASAAASVAGTLQTVANLSGAVASGAPATSGSLQTPKNVSGSVTSSAPSCTGAIEVETASVTVSGAVTSSPPTTLGSLQLEATITGAVVSSSPTSSGALEVVTRISGNVATSSPTTEGFIHRTLFISGDVVTSAPTTAGSILLGVQPRGETQAQVGFDFSVAEVDVDLRSGVLVADDPGVVVVLHLDVSKVEIGVEDDDG